MHKPRNKYRANNPKDTNASLKAPGKGGDPKDTNASLKASDLLLGYLQSYHNLKNLPSIIALCPSYRNVLRLLNPSSREYEFTLDIFYVASSAPT